MMKFYSSIITTSTHPPTHTMSTSFLSSTKKVKHVRNNWSEYLTSDDSKIQRREMLLRHTNDYSRHCRRYARTKSLLCLNLILRSASSNVAVDVASKYEVVSRERVEEFDLGVTRYRHVQSGADVISVRAPKDDNKVFGITFRTPPEDSTGIAHIMEHSVLCGSRKYTSKEPFVELLKGSLQTFLNAFTYPDRTCYPVASQNLKDYHNLINVYLDAVLHPRALNDPQVLQQEGWHYELEDLNEEMKYKGVVYNEMKGVYSSPEALAQRHASRILFPGTIYSHDYGGDVRTHISLQ